MNPEVKGPISSVSSKRSNRSQKIQENLLNLKNYEKQKSYRGRKSADNKLISTNVLKASGSKSGSFNYSNNERKIKVYEKKLLGIGSGGTCVFEGKLHGRVVAVKRMLH